LLEAIVGCAFFGTPFHGAEAASLACMLSQVGEKVGTSTASKLLELMRPNDEYVNELRKDFIRLSVQTEPQIQLYGFYEQHPTTIKDLNGMPKILQDLNIPLPKKVGEFVTRESAALDGVMESMGLTANHRDLVKFKSSTDGRYLLVLGPLKRLIKGSGPRVKARHNATRGVDRILIEDAREVLEGASVKRKRAVIKRNTTTSPWFSKEPEFIGWLSEPNEAEDVSLVKKCDCLWVRGRDGRGKTSAALSAIEKIEESINDHEEEEGRNTEESHREPSQVYLAYFFCDNTPDYGIAEELLKSLIHQIISKQELAATHAKFLLKKKGRDSAALLTVENLWQVLQDILLDDVFLGARMYFVINNLETISPDAASTATLLSLLSSEVEHDGSGRSPIVRWMFTSGQSWDIDQALRKPLVRLVDLEDEKYGDQVQLELRKHAQKKVQELVQHKRYSKALVYFTSSVIGQRAQNTQWIDITCDSLEDLPQHQNDLQVRRLLEGVPQELDSLLNAAWKDVFEKNRSKTGEIKELLRVLVLTYTDPTEAELGLLAGLQSSNEDVTELHDLILKCRPLIVLKRNKGGEPTVCFAFPVVKTHLLENAHKLLGLSEDDIKLQHGILGFRAFSHVMEAFGEFADEDVDAIQEDADGEGDDEAEDSEEEVVDQQEVETDQNDESNDTNERYDDNADNISESSGDEGEEEEYEDEDPEASRLRNIALAYAVTYWLDHASQATDDIAEALSLEEKFWEKDSKIRRRWLTEHNRMTGSFGYFQRSSLTGLHIAAAIGFRGLVSALLDNGYATDKDTYDDLDNQPLHFAAYNDKSDIVEELLDQGANIDAGHELDAVTPLGMAAEAGNVKIMTQLLQRGADPNASCSASGAVICSAIDSGNTEAVKLLVALNVSLVSPEEDDVGDPGSEKGDGKEEDKEGDEDGEESEEESEDEDDDDEEDEDEDEDEIDEKVIKSPLALAAMRADLTVFEFLLSEYSDKLPASELEFALITAAEWGRTEAFTRLFNDFELSQEAKQKALVGAAGSAEGHWDIVTLILERCPGLNCDRAFLSTAKRADGDDEIRILEAMWEYTQGGISPESLDECLYEATDFENKRTIELLLRYGASANATGQV
jgi:ankyrin repeat protein